MKRRILFILCFLGMMSVPMLFQNCGAPQMEEGDLPGSGPLSTTFAYDSTVDHLAYMSCSAMQAPFDANAFFTFKAGAYDTGSGVKLSAAFLNNSRNLTGSQKVEALQGSALNNGTYFQLGIRRNQQFQTLLAGNGAYGDFIGPLSLTTNANALVALPINTRANVLGGVRFEEKIQFVQTAETTVSSGLSMEGFRQELKSGNSLVALAYANEVASAAKAIAPTEGSNTSVYGTGFAMDFVLGHSIGAGGAIANYSIGSPRVMRSVQEYSLQTGQQSANIWDCASDWSFMIVRSQDQVTTCSDASDNPVPANAAQQTALTELRKILPVDKWSVSLSRRCVVAKVPGNCYGSISAINYAGPNCSSALGNCPHYVTICKKR